MVELVHITVIIQQSVCPPPSSLLCQVLYLQAAVLVWAITTVVKKTFFGTLRAAEVEVAIFSLAPSPPPLQLHCFLCHVISCCQIITMSSCIMHKTTTLRTHLFKFTAPSGEVLVRCTGDLHFAGWFPSGPPTSLCWLYHTSLRDESFSLADRGEDRLCEY